MKRFVKKPITSASEGSSESRIDTYIASLFRPTLLRAIKEFVEIRMDDLEYYVEEGDFEELSRFTADNIVNSLKYDRDDGDGRWDEFERYGGAFAYIYLLDNMPEDLLKSIIINYMEYYSDVLDTSTPDGQLIRDILLM